jgi:hypothetical protein
MVAKASKIISVDLIDEITVTADPILAMMIGIDVITAAIIEVIVVMIATMIVTVTGATIDVARMTTTTKTTIARS